MDLSCIRATSSSVDLYRNGGLIATVPNNRFYTDPPTAAAMTAISRNYARRAQVTALTKLL